METSQRTIKGILKKKDNPATAVANTSAAPEISGPSPTVAGLTQACSGEKSSKKSQKETAMNLSVQDSGLPDTPTPTAPYLALTGDSDEENSSSDLDTPQATVSEFLPPKLTMAHGKKAKFQVSWSESSEDEDLKRQFELKRKLHYNEGRNIQFARQLISIEQFSNTSGATSEDEEIPGEVSEADGGTAIQPSACEEPDENAKGYDIRKL
ncbi:protein phosphatase inhibitor 2-like [Macrotis lagotis]|uniref:protein phosphatase inhibitor 2-like n=1 Tax=Macrotis lagotis TaxID=92651 RepID=UPI003D696664